MKTEIQIFKNEMFGEVRTMTNEKGEPFFVGSDIARALGYKNTRKALIDHVDDENKGVTKRDTLGGIQQMVIINESGLYSLVLSSKLPQAKDFKRWVTSEVLPADDCFTASEVAENLDITANVLNHFLVDKGIQYWNGSRYKLKSQYAECGYAEEREVCQ